MRNRLAGLSAFALLFGLAPAATISAQVVGTDITYTTDAGFDRGTLVSVNHDPPGSDQLQLDSPTEPFPFINVAASGRGTVVRVNTDTGSVVGEYRTAPDGRGLDPSRTTVDLFGSVWTANRGEVGEIGGVPHGSAVKIGLIVGGTRTDGSGSSDPAGGYLAPPFGYSTCVDRDGDGLIRTSMGLGDILAWPDVTDGLGGSNGLVEDAVDECILIYQRLPDAEQTRHVSVDADNNVWVGGYPFVLRTFYKLDGSTGEKLDSFDARDFGCGGYGGLVDGNGIVWSFGWGTAQGPLLRYDPADRTGSCIDTYGGYGLGIDTNGYVWTALWDNGIVKVSPGGVVEPGYPKSTWPASSTATGFLSPTVAGSASPLLVAPSPERDPVLPPAQADPLGELTVPVPAAPVPARQPLLPAAELVPQADDLTDPAFAVAPDDDWVGSQNRWPAGSTISLTIADGGGVLYTDSQTADPSGNFNFNLWDVFDVQRGQVVTVSDGTTTKTHTVMDLYVDGVDIAADTVSGRAVPGSEVHVWVNDNGDLTVTADGSGNWTADFSGLTDLTYASNGGSQQSDEDGDATHVGWWSPAFAVAPDDDWVGSQNPWPAGSTISLTIADGGGVLYTDSQTADPSGNFNFNLWDVFDVQRGQVVTVSDGTTTKTHTVMDLYVDGVDIAADTVFGRAAVGSDVDVWVHQDDSSVTVTADGSGNWTADFSGMTDLTYLSDGNSQQLDGDGDATRVFWASPKFQVAPDDDWVGSQNRWPAGSTISLTIADGGGVLYTDSQTADPSGNFNFNLWDVFDVQRGQVVTVSDGTTTKTHTVMDLYVDGVDIAADTVSGRADAGSEVHVWVHQGDGNVTVTADGSGHWTADFAGITDLTYLTDGASQQLDDEGDGTWVSWASPRFQVAPDDDWVQSSGNWSPGATISLTIENGGVLYTASQTADPVGRFNFNLGGVFDIERGQVVTVSDGTTTKTHTVMDLHVDAIDIAADTVSGRAAAGSEVDVWVHGDGNVTAAVDGSGHWTADFSATTDLTYLSDGGSQQTDTDGDSTGVWWAPPRFQVAPDDDWVGSQNPWPAGSTISLTIDSDADPGNGVLYTASQTADPSGNFNFNLGGVFDVQRGQVVTVSDGTTTKVHVVTDVDVTEIDAAADRITGTAEPDAWVRVDASLFADWSTREVQADSAGVWAADFSLPQGEQAAFDITEATMINVSEFDDDGDSTAIRFGPPVQANRGVAVTPIDNHVWVANSGVGTVTRLDNDGNIVKVIETGTEPTGVAVDAAGKVWVTNLGSDNTVRIDPGAGADGLGGVDLTVDLGPGASPYNYSDMTGAVVVGSTSPQGFWTVIQDSGEAGFEWGRLTWNTEPQASEPAGTEIVVETRTSDSEAGLGGATFIRVSNGELFSSFGRYIEVRVTLKASPEGLSPVLSDIRVQPAIIEVAVDIKPGSYPNSINPKGKGVIPVAVLGTADFDVTTIDAATLRFGPDLAVPAHNMADPGVYRVHLEDVNKDDLLDLVSHYAVGDTGLAYGDTEACLIGETVSGIPIKGCDSVRMLGKS